MANIIVTPLYGHTSLETAYCAEDYPYGRLRTKMYFFLETKDKKGVRFVSQSLNPKTGRMNKPHPSTYSMITGNMYLDENGHCQWAVVTEYTDAEAVYEFIKAFPQNHRMDLLTSWCKAKYILDLKCTTNKRGPYTPVGEEASESDLQRWTKEMGFWKKAYNLSKGLAEDSEIVLKSASQQ